MLAFLSKLKLKKSIDGRWFGVRTIADEQMDPTAKMRTVWETSGYLLSSFLSPHTNRRSDSYGGTAEKRRKLLLEIVEKIRAKVKPSFVACLGVFSLFLKKIN